MKVSTTLSKRQTLPVGLRAAIATVPIVGMVMVTVWVDAMVTSYAAYMCRWPATISCDDGWGGWRLASTWFLFFSLICGSGVVVWVIRGSSAAHLWPVVAMTAGFPILALASEPRDLSGGDLFVFGIYVTYAVFISWQVLSEWFPAARRALAITAMVIAVLQIGVLAAAPTVLVDVAERNGLTDSP